MPLENIYSPAMVNGVVNQGHKQGATMAKPESIRKAGELIDLGTVAFKEIRDRDPDSDPQRDRLAGRINKLNALIRALLEENESKLFQEGLLFDIVKQIQEEVPDGSNEGAEFDE